MGFRRPISERRLLRRSPASPEGFCMKGGGACRAAEPSRAERCAPSRAGEAGPQPCSRPRGEPLYLHPPPSNRSRRTPVRRKWVNSTKATAPFPPSCYGILALSWVHKAGLGAREAGAGVGQGPWVVQGDRPTSISGSWQGRRWRAIVPALIRSAAARCPNLSAYLGANTHSPPLLTVPTRS